MEKVTQGQLIALMSHTLGSIGQVLKNKDEDTLTVEEKEILRIYRGYIKQIAEKWS